MAKTKTAKEVWDSLKTRYLGADRIQKAILYTLKSEFEPSQMNDAESIDEFTCKLSGMILKYISLGTTLEDEVLVRKLLDSVPDKYLQLVASIKQYSDIDTMSFEEAICRLKAYENRIRLRSGIPSTEGSLLLSRTDGQAVQKTSGGSSSNGRARGSASHDRGGRNGGCGKGSTRDRGGRGGSGWQKIQGTTIRGV